MIRVNLQKFIGIVSTLWITTSLIFNVGYYSIIGLEFYSAFSIGDHIASFLKPISYLPYILIPFAILSWIYSLDWNVLPKAQSSGIEVKELRKRFKSFSYNFGILTNMLFLYLILWAFTITYTVQEVFAFIFLAFWCSWLSRTTEKLNKITIARISARTGSKILIIFLLGIFFVGVAFARFDIKYLHSNVTITTTEGTVIKATMQGYYSFGALITNGPNNAEIILFPSASIKNIIRVSEKTDKTISTKFLDRIREIKLGIKEFILGLWP